MRNLALFLTFALLCGLSFSTSTPTYAEWTEYKATYGKTYNITQDAIALANFALSRLRCAKMNNITLSNLITGQSVCGDTIFSDWSQSDFIQKKTGYIAPSPTSKRSISHTSAYTDAPLPPPTTKNWCTAGYCSAIKDQGQCGSCWAYSSTSATESCIAINANTPNSISILSPQFLIDCDNTGAASYCPSTTYNCNSGCDGGSIPLDFIQSKGHVLESRYPSNSSLTTAATCRSMSTYDVILSSYVPLSRTEQQMAADLAQSGPVVCAVDATAWQDYKGGIMSAAACAGTALNHAVVLVGYNLTEKSWTIRNSWGNQWGEKGFIRIQFNASACLLQGYQMPLQCAKSSTSTPTTTKAPAPAPKSPAPAPKTAPAPKSPAPKTPTRPAPLALTAILGSQPEALSPTTDSNFVSVVVGSVVGGVAAVILLIVAVVVIRKRKASAELV